ncbi:NAC transcription factor 47-like [Phalaenopsis equestris]|uniref:NAC transcription factor 47-like n=1 Tax=Phalaenopsis equestris TaxID=78828 RepID=UPI0009E57D85|nr:NAC transcription factor 47-like [Phalaenopsis equestris]
MYNPATQLPPGFRFHPTDEELIVHYLRKRTAPVSIIAAIDIYKFDPWDLPEKAVFGDREWYFFSPRERKYPNGVRPNRAAVSGYWKATGTDKFIRSGGDNVGVKKALVFYKGKPPKGLKTDWIMHEYRVAESLNTTNSYRPLSMRLTDDSMRLDDWVLCRIYKKSKHVSPPLIDREHEDSSTDDASFPIQNLPLRQPLQDFPKTSSVSEALEDFSQLFNGFYSLHDLQRFDKNPLIGHPISSLQQTNHDSNDSNGHFLPQLSQKEPSDSINLKNQKHDEMDSKEEINGTFQNFYGQFDSSDYSFPNQQFLRLPQPINSHLGLQ